MFSLCLAFAYGCEYDNGGCSQLCVPFAGSHMCKCNPGYTLDRMDKKSCFGNCLFVLV